MEFKRVIKVASFTSTENGKFLTVYGIVFIYIPEFFKWPILIFNFVGIFHFLLQFNNLYITMNITPGRDFNVTALPNNHFFTLLPRCQILVSINSSWNYYFVSFEFTLMNKIRRSSGVKLYTSNVRWIFCLFAARFQKKCTFRMDVIQY